MNVDDELRLFKMREQIKKLEIEIISSKKRESEFRRGFEDLQNQYLHNKARIESLQIDKLDIDYNLALFRNKYVRLKSFIKTQTGMKSQKESLLQIENLILRKQQIELLEQRIQDLKAKKSVEFEEIQMMKQFNPQAEMLKFELEMKECELKHCQNQIEFLKEEKSSRSSLQALKMNEASLLSELDIVKSKLSAAQEELIELRNKMKAEKMKRKNVKSRYSLLGGLSKKIDEINNLDSGNSVSLLIHEISKFLCTISNKETSSNILTKQMENLLGKMQVVLNQFASK